MVIALLCALLVFALLIAWALFELFPGRHVHHTLVARYRTRRARPTNEVRAALEDQLEYETGHAIRQHNRMQLLSGMEGVRHVRHTFGPVLREHGQYDRDQRVLSVLIRVRTAYRLSNKNPPDNIEQLVEEAVK